jgi:hypothetical protein
VHSLPDGIVVREGRPFHGVLPKEFEDAVVGIHDVQSARPNDAVAPWEPEYGPPELAPAFLSRRDPAHGSEVDVLVGGERKRGDDKRGFLRAWSSF